MDNFEQTTLASLNIVRSLTKKFGGDFYKKFGQNFLVNQQSLLRFIKLINLNSEDTVIEIGPGIGVISYTLCQSAKKVYLIEIDREKEEAIKKTLENFDNYEIIWADASTFDFSTIKAQPGSEIKVISSLPYNVGKKIIYNILNSTLDWKEAAFILQKEVAESYTTKAPKADFLGIFSQIYSDIDFRFLIPSEHFFPRPKVQSAVVYLKKSSKFNHLNKADFSNFIKTGFLQPRKTVLNNLKSRGLKKEDLNDLGIKESIRPSELTVEDWEKIYNFVHYRTNS